MWPVCWCISSIPNRPRNHPSSANRWECGSRVRTLKRAGINNSSNTCGANSRTGNHRCLPFVVGLASLLPLGARERASCQEGDCFLPGTSAPSTRGRNATPLIFPSVTCSPLPPRMASRETLQLLQARKATGAERYLAHSIILQQVMHESYKMLRDTEAASMCEGA